MWFKRFLGKALFQIGAFLVFAALGVLLGLILQLF